MNATSTKGKATVWRIEDRRNFYGVESQSVTFMYWRVYHDPVYDTLSCRGNSEHERCWPFSMKGYCKHTEAVHAFLVEQAATPSCAPVGISVYDLFPE